MKFDIMRSGLIVPHEEPPTPPKTYGPVELRDEKLRDRVASALTGVLNSFELRFNEPDVEFKRDYIRSAIASLLGDDYCYEEKT